MKTIEFIALPGAGKSTIRQLLISQLQKNALNQWLTVEQAFYLAARKNIDAHLRLILNFIPEKLAIQQIGKLYNRSQWQQEAQSQFLANHSVAFSSILSCKTYQFSSTIDRQKGIHAFLGVGSERQCILNHGFPNQNIVFDEGLIQKSLIFIPTQAQPDSSNDFSYLYNYLDNIPKPDILIYIKTDIETALQRMHSRADGLTERLKMQDEKKILSFLSRSLQHLDKTTDFLQKESDVKIISIENNASLKTAVESLASALKDT